MEIITSTENYSACGPIDGGIIDNILRVHSVLDLSHEAIDDLTYHFNSFYMNLLIGRYRNIKDQIRVYEHLRSCFDAHVRYADFVLNNRHKLGYMFNWCHYELELKGYHRSLVVNEAMLCAAHAAREDFWMSWCIDLIEGDWYVAHEESDCSDVCIVNWVNGYSISRRHLEDGSFEELLLNEVWFSGECIHGFMELVKFLWHKNIYTKVTRKDDFRARRSEPMPQGYYTRRQEILNSLFAEYYIDANDSPALNPDALAEENRNLREQIELLRAENDRLRTELQDKAEMLHTTDTTAEAEAAPPAPTDPAVVKLRQFFNNDDDTKAFVNYARKHSQSKLTDYINTLNKAGNIHFDTKTDLYQALCECGLYNRSDRNFYQRVF